MAGEKHSYAIRHDHMVTRKDGEIVQSGGDRYAIYISDAIIPASEFANLFENGKTEQEVAKELSIKYGTVLLSGSMLFKRGTEFDDMTLYSPDNGKKKVETESIKQRLYAMRDELNNMINSVEEAEEYEKVRINR